mgnify:CR=1 FL=1
MRAWRCLSLAASLARCSGVSTRATSITSRCASALRATVSVVLTSEPPVRSVIHWPEVHAVAGWIADVLDDIDRAVTLLTGPVLMAGLSDAVPLDDMRTRSLFVDRGVMLLVVIFAVVAVTSSVVVINAGEVGVRHAFGSVAPEPLLPGIRFVTPTARHAGQDAVLLAARHRVYEQARRRHPARWSRHTRKWTPIGTVWLNPETRARAETIHAERSV